MPPSLFGKSTPAPLRRTVRPAGQVETPRETLKRKLGGVEVPLEMSDDEVSRLLANDDARAAWLAARTSGPAVARQTLMLRLDVHDLPPELSDADVTALLAMDGPTRTTWFRAQPFCTPPAEGFASEALRQAWADSHRWCPPPALSTVRAPGGAPLMEVPDLLSPGDANRVLANSNVTFSWKTVRGAASYEVRVCTDAAMTQGCLPGGAAQITGLNTTFAVPAGDYFWNVRAIGADGTVGPVSATRHLASAAPAASPSLAAPTLAGPTDAALVVANGTVAFSWNSVANATGYEVQVCTDAAMTQGCLQSGNGRTAAPDATMLLFAVPAGDYFWRVRAIAADGTLGPASEVRHLASAAPSATTTTPPGQPLPPPTLIAPADMTHADPDTLVTFSWALVPGAAGHELVVCTDPGMTVGCLTGQGRLPAPQSTLTVSIPAGTYYWTVRGIAEDGTVGHSAGVRRLLGASVAAPFQTSVEALTSAPAPTTPAAPQVAAKASAVPWILGAAALAGAAWWLWPKSDGPGPHSNPSHSFIGSRVTKLGRGAGRRGTILSLEGSGPMMNATVRWEDGSVGTAHGKDLGLVG